MVSDEFSFIQQYFARMEHAAYGHNGAQGKVVLGIGDDAAIIPMQGNYAITTDTLVENVHFFTNFNPKLLGARALEVNFSDVYAMGALPQYLTLSLDIPERYLDFDEFWQPFAQGVEECLARHNCYLIGGNVTRSNNRNAPLTISATAFGQNVDNQRNLRRSGAKVGDLIYVTGSLGANGLYVKTVYNNTLRNLDLEERRHFEEHAFHYDERIAAFIPHVIKYSQCGIDVSDGLLGDLSHILMQSHCCALLNYESLPLDEVSRELLPHFKVSPKSLLKLGLSAGGDYNLIFTVPAHRQTEFEAEIAADPTLQGFLCTCIGQVVASDDPNFDWEHNALATDGGLITIVNNQGEPTTLRLGVGSYNHFLSNSSLSGQ